MQDDRSPVPGDLLAGRYRLDRLVARGGTAQVWKGTDLVLGRTVAIKVLLGRFSEEPTFVERFRREAQAAARLNHPHIVAIFDSVSAGGLPALILEYVRGITLRQRLDDGPLEVHVAVEIAAQVAEALQAAHQAGVIHRDIKPGNILLGEGEPTNTHGPTIPQVRVTDFGIAKATTGNRPDLTTAGTVVGTAKYLAPEQVDGRAVDARTDVFALGVVLYEMLTGQVPWQGVSDLATATARLEHDAISPRLFRPEIPAPLEAVILRAVAREPDRRFADAAALRAALLAADPGPAALRLSLARVDTNEAVPSRRPASSTRTRRRRMVPAGLVALLGIGVLAMVVGRSPATVDPENPGASVSVAGNASTSTLDAGSTVVEGLVATAFDPFGDGEENDELATFLVDGQRTGSAWRTECYVGDFADIPKAGVGFVLDAGRRRSFNSLELITRQAGWRAAVYVRPDLPDARGARDLAAWGTPAAVIDAATPVVQTTFPATDGRVMVVFFTSIAAVPVDDCFGERANSHRVEVLEAILRAPR